MLLGNAIFSILSQLLKAKNSMVSIPSFKITVFKLVQPSKQLPGMVLIPLGIVMLSSEVQL